MNDLDGSRFSMLRVLVRHADTTVVRLPTEVDYDNASDIGARCQDLIREGCATLVLDASDVHYLDSSGVSMIITLSRALDNHAGTLRLAALSDHYQQVWRLLGLDTLLPVFPTVHAALSRGTGACATSRSHSTTLEPETRSNGM
ncbi:STAS domain-containing protein [Streptomyces sp.]|uniref:STAS domain-containing protein n=1 Tax=Streptomyces sp. TaxID=1931 RepID=UPI0025FB7E1E|nr:STAS domain-containing protein [Streptomyces sp.]